MPGPVPGARADPLRLTVVLVELAVTNLGVIPDGADPHRIRPRSRSPARPVRARRWWSRRCTCCSAADRTRPGSASVRDEAVVEGLFAVGDTEWVAATLRAGARVGRGRTSTASSPPPPPWPSWAPRCSSCTASTRQQSLLAPRIAACGARSLRAASTARRSSTPVVRVAEADAACSSRSAVTSGRGPGSSTCAGSRSTRSTRSHPSPGEDDALDARGGPAGGRGRPPRGRAARGGAARRRRRRPPTCWPGPSAALGDAAPFDRVRDHDCVDLGAELADCTDASCVGCADTIEPDDERLAEVRDRRHQLVQLRRKYGDTLDEVLEHRERDGAARSRSSTAHDEVRARREAELGAARSDAGSEASQRRRRARVGRPPGAGRQRSRRTWASWRCPVRGMEVDGRRHRRVPRGGRGGRVPPGGQHRHRHRRAWPRSPRAASCPGSCWRCGWCSPRARPRWSSTRSTPGSVARRRSRWVGRSPRWAATVRCSS